MEAPPITLFSYLETFEKASTQPGYFNNFRHSNVMLLIMGLLASAAESFQLAGLSTVLPPLLWSYEDNQIACVVNSTSGCNNDHQQLRVLIGWAIAGPVAIRIILTSFAGVVLNYLESKFVCIFAAAMATLFTVPVMFADKYSVLLVFLSLQETCLSYVLVAFYNHLHKDVSDIEERSRLFGFIQIGRSIGILGAPISFLLYNIFENAFAPFSVVGLLTTLTAVTGAFITERQQVNDGINTISGTISHYRSVLCDIELDVFLLMTLVGNFALSIYISSIPSKHSNYGNELHTLGTLILIGFIWQSVTTLLVTVILNKVRNSTLLFFSLMGQSVGLFISDVCLNPWDCVGADAISRTGIGAAMVAFPVTISYFAIAKADSAPAVFSIYQSIVHLGALLGYITSAMHFQNLSVSHLNVAVACFLVLFAILSLVIRNKENVASGVDKINYISL